MSTTREIESRLLPQTQLELARAHKALVKAIRGNAVVQEALTSFATARRKSAGETLLSPDTTQDEILMLRGKAQFMVELLTICEAARQADENDDDEGDD